MKMYFLDNYSLSEKEILQSLFISEYGLRHLNQARRYPQHKWGHRMIAYIELCPLIGVIASLIEAIVHKLLNNTSPVLNRKWLFRGSQVGCYGKVSIKKADKICEKLESLSQNQSLGIHFNKANLTKELTGGACTSMSLKYLNTYFKIKKHCKNKPNYRTNVINRLFEKRSRFESCSKNMRNLQAALNTIEIIKADTEADICKNKIQALINHHNFFIKSSSEEIDLMELDARNQFKKEVDRLPSGAYFLRILEPSENCRLEESGHSLIYTKEKGVDLFYDPNFGVRDLSQSEHSDVIFNRLKPCQEEFAVHKVRFYRVKPRKEQSN